MITYKRGPGKHNSDFRFADFYRYYISERDLCNKDITQAEYTAVLKDFHEMMTNLMIYKNIAFDIPYIGKIAVVKGKNTGKMRNMGGKVISTFPVDYKKTKELWSRDPKAKEEKKIVYHLNENTDKYVMKVAWDKNKKLLNQSAYKFTPLRRIKRKITEALKVTNYKVDFYLKESYG